MRRLLTSNTSKSKLASIVILLLVTILLISACASSSIKIVNSLAKNRGYTLTENISYGPHHLNKLDLYLPKQANSTGKAKAVVMFFYGGCWGSCLKFRKEAYLFVGQALANKGHIVVIANYRTYPQVRFQVLIRDAARSVEWVKENIGRYNGDSKSIFLMGHSAGAHMAATLAYDKRYLKRKTWKSIKGMIGLAGPYDFYPFKENYQFKVFAPKLHYLDSQPIRFVTGKEAASLLLYGDKDRTVKRKNIINLAKRIREKGGVVKTHYYRKLGHIGLIASMSRPFQRSRPVLNNIHQFIQKHSSHSGLMYTTIKK